MLNSIKLKGSVDFYRYMLTISKEYAVKLVTNAIILCLQLWFALYLHIHIKEVCFVNLILLALVVYNIVDIIILFRKLRGTTQEKVMAKTNTIKKNNNFIDINEIYSNPMGDWDYITHHINGDLTLSSSELDQYLWSNSFTVEVDTDKPKRVREFIKRNKSLLLPFLEFKHNESLKDNKYFFNQDKLGLSSDFVKGSNTVRVHKGTYFDSFLTNEACISTLTRECDGIETNNATSLFPCKCNKEDSQYYLEDIATSRMNNHVGVSTVAFTEDNYCVIRVQNSRTQYNNGKYVPTGSGSCDWTDLTGNNFNETICNAMQRELCEENFEKFSIHNTKLVGTTKILGYFRWLTRCGKPEFVGITKLEYSYNDLKENKEEFINNQCIVTHVKSIDDILKCIEDINRHKNISVPLVMCLNSLTNYCEEHPDDLKKLLNID